MKTTTGQILGKAHKLCAWLRNDEVKDYLPSSAAVSLSWVIDGVYFVSTDRHQTLAGPQREAEGWDVADVLFFAGSYTNAHENREAKRTGACKRLGP